MQSIIPNIHQNGTASFLARKTRDIFDFNQEQIESCLLGYYSDLFSKPSPDSFDPV